MVELIFLIILVLSLGGIVFILYKKAPVLTQLPEIYEGVKKESIVNTVREKIKEKSFDKLVILKALSKIRVFVLKIEKQVDNWLQNMRKRIMVQKQESDKKKNDENKNNPPS